MDRRRAFAVAALTTVLLLPLSGCAGTGSGAGTRPGNKVRLSAKRMCEAHGGTYNAQNQSCSYASQVRQARQTCQDQGGDYLPEEQYCEIQAGQ
jgi:hypothetical protein